MKKVFLFIAVASIFVACNKPAPKAEEAQDSIATEVVAPADSAVVADSTAVADSAAVVK
ncbi:MAG: hypothetical protein ACYC2P_04865 [Paludibacteraceae bacterium]